MSSCSARVTKSATRAGPTARRTYNAGYGVKSLDDLHAVIAFFEERRGRLYGFRWRDHLDCKSRPPQQPLTAPDQAIGTGDGTQAAFQLVKTYGSAFAPWTREIDKPVAGTVRVAVAGDEKIADTHFTVDTATGIVTFLPGHLPAAGAAVTAGFEFDVPVRFDTDRLEIIAARASGTAPFPTFRSSRCAYEEHCHRGLQRISQTRRDDAVLVLAADAARRPAARVHRSRSRSAFSTARRSRRPLASTASEVREASVLRSTISRSRVRCRRQASRMMISPPVSMTMRTSRSSASTGRTLSATRADARWVAR